MATFKKILIPYDGSEASKRAAIKGFDLARDEDAEVIGLKVISFVGELIAPSDRLWATIEEGLNKKARAIIEELEPIAKEKGIKFSSEVKEGPAENEMIACAKEVGADLIVMGATGKSASKRHLGKTVNRMVKDAPCPVLVVQ